MLLNSDGRKRGIEIVSDELWRHLKLKTYEGIKEKLEASKQLLGRSIAISAGLYTHASEEYGKLLLLQRSQSVKGSNKRIINYASEFTNHEKKLETAFDHLQSTRHEYCYVLNAKGGFSPKSFSWRSFTIGLLADTEARLAIFHSDLKDSSNGPMIQDIPEVEKEYLKRAIEELNVVIASTVP